MTDLRNVDDALKQILAQIAPLSTEKVALEAALGRNLAQAVQATINLPPFPSSAVDGYAVRSGDIQTAPVSLRIVADIPAGKTADRRLETNQAARIMTGAPVPDGADAVVPVEATDSTWNADNDSETMPETVRIQKPFGTQANIRPIGENIRKGAPVLAAGTVLRPQDIGMLASLGIHQADVYRRPRVAVISTGDELINITETLTPGKIYDSNGYTVAALVQSHGGEALRFSPAKDSAADVEALFQRVLGAQPDILVSTGGVSVGKYDVVRAVVEKLGEIAFWKINLRPGKPLAYGQINGVPFFGLPGNPVSAMVTFDLFVRPVMMKMVQAPTDVPLHMATTDEDLTSDGRQTYARVKLTRRNGILHATTTGTQSSGALMSMVVADGLLIIPAGQGVIPAGTRLPVQLLRNMPT